MKKWRRLVNTIAPWPMPVSEKGKMKIKKSLFCNWKLIPNVFIAYLPIFVLCKNEGAGGAVCALLPITVRDGTVTLEGSQRIEDGQIFPKNLRASLFNDDLSNEPNFGQIHLAGQHLSSTKMFMKAVLYNFVYLKTLGGWGS